MTRCCPRHRMPWSGATGAIARGKNRSTGYARRDRSVHAWRWICGAKPKPKAVNKPSPHFIVHGLDKPGDFTTVSENIIEQAKTLWKLRWSLLKKPGNLSVEEKQALAELEREDEGFVQRFRTIIRQLVHIFDHAHSEAQAKLRLIGKYLSRLRKFDQVIALQERL